MFTYKRNILMKKMLVLATAVCFNDVTGMLFTIVAVTCVAAM